MLTKIPDDWTVADGGFAHDCGSVPDYYIMIIIL